jgi:hypothetical protein
LNAAQKAVMTSGTARLVVSTSGSLSLFRPRCSAAFTAPTVVESASAISSKLSSNTSLSTTAARSCGASCATNVLAASRVPCKSGLGALTSGAPSSVTTPRSCRTRSIHRLDATRNNHARGFGGACPIKLSVANPRASASCARSSASQGLRVR